MRLHKGLDSIVERKFARKNTYLALKSNTTLLQIVGHSIHPNKQQFLWIEAENLIVIVWGKWPLGLGILLPRIYARGQRLSHHHIDLSSSDLFHITTLTACTTL